MVNWGIIGLGRIAQRFCESALEIDDMCLYAGASHNKEKRSFFKDKFGIEKLYEDYDEMLEDQKIDMIYIALPHKMHYEWSKKAMLKGKGVLCEKPAVLEEWQMKDLMRISSSQHVFFMEGIKTRFIPLIGDLHRHIERGVIGDIQEIHCAFCYDMPYDPSHYLYDPIQGGSLYDTGIYGLAFVLDFIHSQVENMQVKTVFHHGVDVEDIITIYFQDGKKAIIHCGIESPNDRSGAIIGTKGRISMDPFYRPESMSISLSENDYKVERSYAPDDFHGELLEANDAYHHGLLSSKRMSQESSLVQIQLLNQIKEIISKNREES